MKKTIADEIEELNKLREQGVLTEEEFVEAKKKVISGNNEKNSEAIVVIQSQQNKRFITGILGMFLGGLGIHHFYTGHPIYGIIYLLFCWTFIPSILGFIEGIVYLMMSDETFNTKHDATHPDYKK